MKIRKFNESKNSEVVELVSECFADVIDGYTGSKIHALRDHAITFVIVKPQFNHPDLANLEALINYTDALAKMYNDIQYCIEKVYTTVDKDLIRVNTNQATTNGQDAYCIQISIR